MSLPDTEMLRDCPHLQPIFQAIDHLSVNDIAFEISITGAAVTLPITLPPLVGLSKAYVFVKAKNKVFSPKLGDLVMHAEWGIPQAENNTIRIPFRSVHPIALLLTAYSEEEGYEFRALDSTELPSVDLDNLFPIPPDFPISPL